MRTGRRRAGHGDRRVPLAAVIAALVPVALGLGPGSAQGIDTSGVAECRISGWSADPDPAGLNVRAAARKDAPVVGTLPHQPEYAVEFDIVGSSNGWLLIRHAKVPSYGDGPDKPVFAGPGWVFADKVRFEINDPALRAEPEARAPIVLPLASADHSEGPDAAIIDHVFGCRGAFAEIEAHMPAGPHKRGWATRICSNQVTTCV